MPRAACRSMSTSRGLSRAMRAVLVVVLVHILGCDSKGASPAMSGTPPICEALLSAHDRLIECEREVKAKEFLRRSRERLPSLWRGVEGDARMQAERDCALMLGEISKGAEESGCDLRLSVDVRRRIADEQSHRTDVPTTGDAEVDRVIDQMKSLRDRACACTDRACVSATKAELDALPSEPVRRAPAATRDAAGDIVGDLARCASRVLP